MEEAPTAVAAEILRRFWPYARPVPALDRGGPGAAVDRAGDRHARDLTLEARGGRRAGPPGARRAAAYLGLALIGALTSFGDEYVATWVGERFLLDLRADLYRHVHSLSAEQLGRRPVGDLLARLTGDVQAIERFLLGALGEGVSALARIVMFTAALLVLSWKLAIAALIVAPLFYLVAGRFGRLVKHAAREKRRRSGSLTAVAEQALNAAPLVQTLIARKPRSPASSARTPPSWTRNSPRRASAACSGRSSG